MIDTRQPKNMTEETLSQNMKTAIAFVHLVEQHVTDTDAYTDVLHPDVEFIEYPNLITKNGQVRNKENALKGIALGKAILSSQRYDYLDWHETPDCVVIEILWKAVMAIDAGHLKQGQELQAHICMIVCFKDGKIISQRNYDCYQPF